MQITFLNFKWSLREATCECYQFKDCALHYVGLIQAKDGDGLAATCELLEMMHGESELKEKFGPKRILFAYGHALCKYTPGKGSMTPGKPADFRAVAETPHASLNIHRQLHSDDEEGPTGPEGEE